MLKGNRLKQLQVYLSIMATRTPPEHTSESLQSITFCNAWFTTELPVHTIKAATQHAVQTSFVSNVTLTAAATTATYSDPLPRLLVAVLVKAHSDTDCHPRGVWWQSLPRPATTLTTMKSRVGGSLRHKRDRLPRTWVWFSRDQDQLRQWLPLTWAGGSRD